MKQNFYKIFLKIIIKSIRIYQKSDVTLYCQLEIKTTKYMKTLRILIIALISVVTLLTACRRKNEDPIPVIVNNNMNNNNTNNNTTDTTSKNYLKPYIVEKIIKMNTSVVKEITYNCKSLVISDTTFDIISVTSSNNYLYNMKITTKGISSEFDTTQNVDVESNLVITYKTTNIVGKQNTLTMTIPVEIKNGKTATQEVAPRLSQISTIQYFSKTDPSVKFKISCVFVNKQNRHSYVSAISVTKPELYNIYYDSASSNIVIGFANNIITYEVPMITITVSDGKLSSTETTSGVANFQSGGSTDAYFIMQPYLDKPIKSITASNLGGQQVDTRGKTNLSWGAKNYDKTVAAPQLSYIDLNGGSEQKVWFIDDSGKLFYGNSFDDPYAMRGTITKTANGFSLYSNLNGVTFTFNY